MIRDGPEVVIRSAAMATAQNPDELPTVTGKKRTVKVRATLTEFGRDWRLIRPNSIIASQLMDAGDNINPVYISKYFAAHVHPDERAEFIEAAENDDSLDLEDLMDLMNRLTEAVYSDMPAPESGD